MVRGDAAKADDGGEVPDNDEQPGGIAPLVENVTVLRTRTVNPEPSKLDFTSPIFARESMSSFNAAEPQALKPTKTQESNMFASPVLSSSGFEKVRAPAASEADQTQVKNGQVQVADSTPLPKTQLQSTESPSPPKKDIWKEGTEPIPYLDASKFMGSSGYPAQKFDPNFKVQDTTRFEKVPDSEKVPIRIEPTRVVEPGSAEASRLLSSGPMSYQTAAVERAKLETESHARMLSPVPIAEQKVSLGESPGKQVSEHRPATGEPKSESANFAGQASKREQSGAEFDPKGSLPSDTRTTGSASDLIKHAGESKLSGGPDLKAGESKQTVPGESFRAAPEGKITGTDSKFTGEQKPGPVQPASKIAEAGPEPKTSSFRPEQAAVPLSTARSLAETNQAALKLTGSETPGNRTAGLTQAEIKAPVPKPADNSPALRSAEQAASILAGQKAEGLLSNLSRYPGGAAPFALPGKSQDFIANIVPTEKAGSGAATTNFGAFLGQLKQNLENPPGQKAAEISPLAAQTPSTASSQFMNNFNKAFSSEKGVHSDFSIKAPVNTAEPRSILLDGSLKNQALVPAVPATSNNLGNPVAAASIRAGMVEATAAGQRQDIVAGPRQDIIAGITGVRQDAGILGTAIRSDGIIGGRPESGLPNPGARPEANIRPDGTLAARPDALTAGVRLDASGRPVLPGILAPGPAELDPNAKANLDLNKLDRIRKLTAAEGRYITGVEVAIALAIASTAVAKKRPGQNGEAEGEGEESADDLKSLLDQAGRARNADAKKDKGSQPSANAATVYKRPTYSVAHNDDLITIAEKLFHDIDVAWLIADINKGQINEYMEDGKRIIELRSRQQIELPFPHEVQEFLQTKKKEQQGENIVTFVSVSEIDRELLDSFLCTVVGAEAPARKELPASSPVEQMDLPGQAVLPGALQNPSFELMQIVNYAKQLGQGLMPTMSALVQKGHNLKTYISKIDLLPEAQSSLPIEAGQ